MRGDTDQQDFNNKQARTTSENAVDTEIAGINVLKAARYANLICGTGLVVVCGFNIVGVLTSLNIGLFLLNLYLAIFGLIIMASCFMM